MRDVLLRLDSITKADGTPVGRHVAAPLRKAGPPSDPRPRTRRFTGRVRSILTTAAVAAILVNAGVAWTYWRVAEAGHRGDSGPAVEMTLPARSDLNVPLAPGGRGDLLVTLTNNNDFPVRITSVTPGPGNVVADAVHRKAGCTDPVVKLTRDRFPVRWDVQRNTFGAFTIPGGLVQGAGGDRACEGAVFTIPIQATGAGQGS